MTKRGAFGANGWFLFVRQFMQRRADPSTIVTPEVPVTLDESFWMLDADLGEAAKRYFSLISVTRSFRLTHILTVSFL